MHGIPGLQTLATLNHGYSRYKTRPLLQILKETFGDGSIFGGSRVDHESRYHTKVAVTATTDTCELPVIFTNYNRQQLEPTLRKSLAKPNTSNRSSPEDHYRLERPDNPAHELRIWEA